MVKRSAADLEAAAKAGEWLTIGEAAILLGVDRSTVDRMLNADPPELPYRHRSGRGRYREIDPQALLAELERTRRVYGA